jgi:hypothetical protein
MSRTEELIERGANALVRSAEASEELLRLAKEQTEQIEFAEALPTCPYCGKNDPIVTPEETGETKGNASDYFFIGRVHCCDRTVYGIPSGMILVHSVEAAKMLISERKAAGNGSH